MELVAEASVDDVGTGSEGSRKGVMIWLKMMGRVYLVEEVECIQELVGMNKV